MAKRKKQQVFARRDYGKTPYGSMPRPRDPRKFLLGLLRYGEETDAYVRYELGDRGIVDPEYEEIVGSLLDEGAIESTIIDARATEHGYLPALRLAGVTANPHMTVSAPDEEEAVRKARKFGKVHGATQVAPGKFSVNFTARNPDFHTLKRKLMQ